MTALAPQASPQTTPPATPPATKMRLYTEDRVPLGSVLLRVIAGAVVLLIFVMPYVIMLLGSVKSKAEIRSVEPTFFPKEWHWENYLTMWSTPETPLAQNLISTIVIALGATLLVVHVSMPAAYYTARFKFCGSHGLSVSGHRHADVAARGAHLWPLQAVSRLRHYGHVACDDPRKCGIQAVVCHLDYAQLLRECAKRG